MADDRITNARTYTKTVTFEVPCEFADDTIENANIKSAAAIERTKMEQQLTWFDVPLSEVAIWDSATAAKLPSTAATDDLGYIAGTWASSSPVLQSSDEKAKGSENPFYGRFQHKLSHDYVDGETVTIRVYCGFKTTIPDTTGSIDVVAYENDGEQGISADLCTTSAQDFRSLTFANKDFQLDATSLAANDVIDVRLHMAIEDAATGTAVLGTIGRIQVGCDCKY